MKLPASHTRAGIVVKHLTNGPASSAEIGEVLNLTPGEVSTLMNEWRGRKLVERVGDTPGRQGARMGVWALTDSARAALGIVGAKAA